VGPAADIITSPSASVNLQRRVSTFINLALPRVPRPDRVARRGHPGS
jgi:hypothetical protein